MKGQDFLMLILKQLEIKHYSEQLKDSREKCEWI